MHARPGFFALAFLFMAGSAFSIQISEIMPNPSGSDTRHEWVEIYNNETDLNLSGWKFTTDGSDHALDTNFTNEIILSGSYVVIVQNITSFLADYPDFNGTLIDSSWTDLTNSANHTLLLKNSGLVYDNVTFFPGSEGMSLCRGDSWYECVPTPGSNITIAAAPALSNSTYNISLSISAPEIYVSSYEIIVNSTDCSEKTIVVEYWIEDLFGSSVKSRTNTTRTFACSESVSRSWTPDEIEGSEAYTIHATSGGVNASRIIIVKGSAPANSSSVIITGADSGIKFGEQADVDIYVYRGDTAKYSIEIYVVDSSGSKVSTVSKFHASSKMKSYDVQVPVQLKPNCNGEYSDGSYEVVVDGLDMIAKHPINVSGISSANCKTVTVSSGGGGGGGSFSAPQITPFEIVSYPESVYIGEEFQVVALVKPGSGSASLHSYVYSGSTPVSEGFNGKWSGTWTANKQDFDLGVARNATMLLRIEDGTAPGMYNLRVKMKMGGKETEMTKEIQVKGRMAEKNAVKSEEPLQVPSDIPKISVTGKVSVKERKLSDYAGILQLISFLLRGHPYSENKQ